MFRIVGQQQMFTVASAETFRAQRGRYYSASGGPGLQDLEARSAAGKQRHDTHLRLCQVHNGVLHRTDYTNPWIAPGEECNCSRISPQQSPFDSWSLLAHSRPDLSAKP